MKKAFMPVALALCASMAFAEEALVDPVIPALEILGFDILVNRVNRCCGTGRDDYAVSIGSIRRNLRGPWVVDSDPFRVNQFGHPYQGSMYYGFARSAGFDYWHSAAYTF